MRVLWSSSSTTTLLLGMLGLLGYQASTEQGERGGEGCVVGVVGEPVWLPCFYSGHHLDTLNFSVEWRTAAAGGGGGGEEGGGQEVLLLRAAWVESRLVELWRWRSTNNNNTTTTNTTTSSSDVTTSCRMSEDALENGDFSLELSALLPLREAPQTFSMFLLGASVDPDSETSPPTGSPLCTVCLRTAASFTPPSVERLDPPEVNHTTFLCHSVGGRAQPTVHWLINGSLAPPEDSVTTSTLPVVNSTLYRITSRLRADVSHQTNVTCYVENLSLNETLTATSYGVKASPVGSRASTALWVFSAGLSVAVAVLVVGTVVYQVLLDRSYKTHGKTHRGFQYNYSGSTEAAGIQLERPDGDESPNETES